MRLIILFICIALSFEATAQKKIKYKKTPSGLRYYLAYDAPGNPAGDGDVVFFRNWIFKTEKGKPDSLVHQADDGGVLISPEFKKGSIEEGLRTLSNGDSVMYLMNVDSFFTYNHMEVPPFLKKNQDLRFVFKVLRVASKEEVALEMNERELSMNREKLKQAEQYKAELLADPSVKAQLAKDEILLQEYLKKNNIIAERTPNGVYYQILKKGNGVLNVVGEKVNVYYTGKFLDGAVFDTNPVGSGRPPFSFVLGGMEVIMGWDEGLAFLRKGDKAVLYIPSVLAYGEDGAGQVIPPNTCLIFEVEIVE